MITDVQRLTDTIAQMKINNIRLIRKGCYRSVILIGKYAIKIPTFTEWRLFLHGLLSNIKEKKLWKYTHDIQLCPVLWSCPGGFLNIAERVIEVTRDEWQEIPREYLLKISMGFPVEQKPESFGWMNGRLVILDYG